MAPLEPSGCGRDIDEAFLPDFALFGSQRHYWSVAGHVQAFDRASDDLVKRSLSLAALQSVMDGIGCVASFCHALMAKRRGISVAFSLSDKNSPKFLKRNQRRSGFQMMVDLGLEDGVTRLDGTQHELAALVRGWVPQIPQLFSAFSAFGEFHRTPYNLLRHGNCTFSRASVMWPASAGVILPPSAGEVLPL